MQVAAALLCDAASVREGLLFVMGGGITRIWREDFPAPMGVELAVMIEMRQTELARPHEIEVLVQGEDGQRVAEARGGLQAGGEVDFGETLLVPIVIPLRNVGLPQRGRFSLEIAIDGGHHRTLMFQARPASERPGAPT